ncbi:hypothetical protein JZK55_14830 [Dissulfurispira thermophila]|uniref:Uncharacterized protein n=2 Tax=root TaxID=1 RepID=A0A7G1H327_9BACT|nr:hypothetical protein [Dissulfurispira thermophila]BCB96561.1 hypothetical protein JZK55_14830 [Dissulfurispira thermophila]
MKISNRPYTFLPFQSHYCYNSINPDTPRIKEAKAIADEKDREESLTLDKKAIDVLIAKIIPTSKYFESRFDHLQYQINEIKIGIKEFEKRIDSRFEQVNKRFDQIEIKLDKLLEAIDVKIDTGLREKLHRTTFS